jgi:tRNA pseudouridine synthase 10
MFYETIEYAKNKDTEYLLEIIHKKLKEYDVNSFEIGITCSEEDVFLKKEIRDVLINRLENFSYKHNSKEQDVLITIDLTRDVICFELRSVYLYGKYCKYSRNIAQTYHYCPECKGKGCTICEYTGKKTKESVQEIIYGYLKDVFQSKENKFHGAGREDVDVLMLGDGREFVMEFIEPKKRNVYEKGLKDIEDKINKECANKISVNNIKITNKQKVVDVKNKTQKKIYEAVVCCKGEIDINKFNEYKQEFLVKQKTPTRVQKRRANKIRERFCKIIDCKKKNNTQIVVKILADGGLYIKELINGDQERSTPSFSSILGCDCVCEELSVLEIK